MNLLSSFIEFEKPNSTQSKNPKADFTNIIGNKLIIKANQLNRKSKMVRDL